MKNGILKRFLNDKKGSAYVMAAFAVIPIFGMASLAIDYTNKDRMVTELETAAETVALHVAKRVALNPNENAQTFVDEGKSLMASLTNLDISYTLFNVDMNSGKVKIDVKAEIDTYFMHMFGHDTLEARSKTQAQFGRLNVDVAIAIDNSGSMGNYIDSVMKMDAAKSAATKLLDAATASVADLQNGDLKFSVIPWYTHVRLDLDDLKGSLSSTPSVNNNNWAKWIDWHGYSTGHFRYLAPYNTDGSSDDGDMYYAMNGSDEWKDYDPNDLVDVIPLEADSNGVDLASMRSESNIGIITRKNVFQNLNTEWNGCFEHRHGDYRYSFSPPTIPSGWTNDGVTHPANSGTDQFNGDSLFVPVMAPDERDGSDVNSYIWDNRGDSANNSTLNDDNDARVYNSAKYSVTNSSDHYLYYGRSPNGECDVETVLRLTDVRADIDAKITAMEPGGQTDVSTGMEWAMHTLTPWEPLADGGDFSDTQKILVMMTDGDNYTSSADSFYWNYRSFGFWKDNPLESWTGSPSNTKAIEAMDDATKEYCTSIKNAGVKIYFVYFGNPSTAATALRDHCASTPETAISASNAAELEAAFEKIGNDIGKLRLTHYQD